MKIYAEYFFCENILANLILILLTAKIWRIRVSKWKVGIGAVLATAYSFGIFIPQAIFLYHPIAKIIFALLIMKSVFSDRNYNEILKLTATFFGASILLGGAVTAFLYFTGFKGIVTGSIFYIGEQSYITLMCYIIASYLFIHVFLNILKERKMKEPLIVDVTVWVGEKQKSFKGLVDTGNFLKDPISGEPVMIGEAEAVKELLPLPGEDGQMRVIPYSSLGAGAGSMLGIKSQRVEIVENEKKQSCCCAILAVYYGKFDSKGAYELIIHPEMLEKGEEKSA